MQKAEMELQTLDKLACKHDDGNETIKQLVFTEWGASKLIQLQLHENINRATIKKINLHNHNWSYL